MSPALSAKPPAPSSGAARPVTAPPQLHHLSRAMFLQRTPPLKYACPCLCSIGRPRLVAIFPLPRLCRLPSSLNLLLLYR
jgi:hypothetical protein